MSGGAASRGRDEELLLARISAAAGRARLGRRRATYRAPRTERALWWAAGGRAGVWHLPRTGGGPVASAAARLDLYEHGMTAAVGKRIYAIRFDTTVMRGRRAMSSRGITRVLVLVDVDGERIVLRRGDFGRPEEWWPEIRRAVTDAQVPRALAALSRGARLAFGPLWVTRDDIGSGGTTLRWAEVQRIGIRDGFVAVRVAGRWQVWATAASGIPNLCVFHALAEHLAGTERDDD